MDQLFAICREINELRYLMGFDSPPNRTVPGAGVISRWRTRRRPLAVLDREEDFSLSKYCLSVLSSPFVSRKEEYRRKLESTRRANTLVRRPQNKSRILQHMHEESVMHQAHTAGSTHHHSSFKSSAAIEEKSFKFLNMRSLAMLRETADRKTEFQNSVKYPEHTTCKI